MMEAYYFHLSSDYCSGQIDLVGPSTMDRHRFLGKKMFDLAYETQLECRPPEIELD